MKLSKLLYFIFCLCTAIIGKAIHGSIFWAIIDFFLAPLAWLKWLIFEEVTVSIITNAFNFFFK